MSLPNSSDIALEFYHLQLLRQVFDRFKTVCCYKATTRMMDKVAQDFRNSRLKLSSFSRLRQNYQHNMGFYRIGWFITKRIKEHLQTSFDALKPLPAIVEESRECSFEANEGKTAEIQELAAKSVKNSLRSLVKARLATGFNAIEECESYPKSHLSSVLQKTDDIYRRVNSLFNKVNLHIPSKDFSMSALSTAEFDTDRTSKLLSIKSRSIQEELNEIEDRERIWKIWKAWRAYFYQKKSMRFKKDLADEHAYYRYLNIGWKGMEYAACAYALKKRKIRLAFASYVQKFLSRCVYALKSHAKDKRLEKKALVEYRRTTASKIMREWRSIKDKNLVGHLKVKMIRQRCERRTKRKVFASMKVLTKLLMKENLRVDLALTYWHDQTARYAFNLLRRATRISRYIKEIKQKAQYFTRKFTLRKFFEGLVSGSKGCMKKRRINAIADKWYKKKSFNKTIEFFRKNLKFFHKFSQLSLLSKVRYGRILTTKSFTAFKKYFLMKKRGKFLKNKAMRFIVSKSKTSLFLAWKQITAKKIFLKLTYDKICSKNEASCKLNYLDHWVQQLHKSMYRKQLFEYNRFASICKQCIQGWRKAIKNRKLRKEFEFKKLEAMFYWNSRKIMAGWKNVFRMQKCKREIAFRKEKTTVKSFYRHWKDKFTKINYLTKYIQVSAKRKALNTWKLLNKELKCLELFTTKANEQYYFGRVAKVFNCWSHHYYRKMRNRLIVQKMISQKEKTVKTRVVDHWNSKVLKYKEESSKILQIHSFMNENTLKNCFEILKTNMHKEESSAKLKQFSLIMLGNLHISGKAEGFPGSNHEDLNNLVLKSRALSQLFNLKKRKAKLQEIKKQIAIPADEQNYFVERYLLIKQRKVKKIISVWRDLVDTSRIKYKKAVNFDNQRIVLHMSKIVKDWNELVNKNNNLNQIFCQIEEKSKQNTIYRTFSNFKSYITKQNMIKNTIQKQKSKTQFNIFHSWQLISKRSSEHRAKIELSVRKRAHRLVFYFLKDRLQGITAELTQRADNYRLEKAINKWQSALKEKYFAKSRKKKLDSIADNFFKDSSSRRFLNQLERNTHRKDVMVKASLFHTKSSIAKGFDRWRSFHTSNLQPMKKARLFQANHFKRSKKRALQKLRSHVREVSWTNQIQRRLFFFWDCKMRKMLDSWHDLTLKTKVFDETALEFRKKWLLSKGIIGFMKVREILGKTSLQFDILKRKAFKGFVAYREIQRFKVENKERAKEFDFYRRLNWAQKTWKNSYLRVLDKKSKLKSMHIEYLRNYGMRKARTDHITKAFYIWKNVGNSRGKQHITFFEYLHLPCQGKINYTLQTIFVKWMSLIKFNRMSKLRLATSHFARSAMKKPFENWKKHSALERIKRRTRFSVDMFRIASIKSKVLKEWNKLRPKAILAAKKKTRKTVRWNLK